MGGTTPATTSFQRGIHVHPGHACRTRPTALEPRELRIYGHTAMFYWWPVWVTGFLMALLTWTNGTRVALVPAKAEYDPQANVIHVPQGFKLPLSGRPADMSQDGKQFAERMYPDKRLGVIFSLVLFLVILITNVPLRGVSSDRISAEDFPSMNHRS